MNTGTQLMMCKKRSKLDFARITETSTKDSYITSSSKIKTYSVYKNGATFAYFFDYTLINGIMVQISD